MTAFGDGENRAAMSGVATPASSKMVEVRPPSGSHPVPLKDGELLDWVESRGLAADGSLRTDLPPTFSTQGGYSGALDEDKRDLIEVVATPGALLRKTALRLEGEKYQPEDDPDSLLPVAHMIVALGLGLGDWGDAAADRDGVAGAVASGDVADPDAAFEEIYRKLRAGEIAAGEVRDTGLGRDLFRVTLWYEASPVKAPVVAGTSLLLATLRPEPCP